MNKTKYKGNKIEILNSNIIMIEFEIETTVSQWRDAIISPQSTRVFPSIESNNINDN